MKKKNEEAQIVRKSVHLRFSSPDPPPPPPTWYFSMFLLCRAAELTKPWRSLPCQLMVARSATSICCREKMFSYETTLLSWWEPTPAKPMVSYSLPTTSFSSAALFYKWGPHVKVKHTSNNLSYTTSRNTSIFTVLAIILDKLFEASSVEEPLNSWVKRLETWSVTRLVCWEVFFFFFCQYIFYKDGQIANRS